MKAAVLALTAVAGSAHAQCPAIILGPRPLQAMWTIAPGGGVVVAMANVVNENKSGADLLLVQPSWRLRDVNVELAPAAIRTIAPGLVVYDVPLSAGPSLDMLDHHKQRIATITRGAVKALSAPEPKSLVLASSPSRRGTYTAVTATFAIEPADALALVMFRDDKARTPLSWTTVGSSKTLDVYQSGRSCMPPPPFLTPIAGERVVLAWLDTSGRLSPLSKPLAITTK